MEFRWERDLEKGIISVDKIDREDFMEDLDINWP